MQGNNFYFNGADPLLSGGRNYADAEEQLEEMERMQEELARRKRYLQEARNRPDNGGSRTPVWDEIDTLMGGLSEQEYRRITENEEFRASQDRVMGVLQRIQLQAIKPQVEASKEGKEALDCHLTLVKRLRNAVSKEVDEEMNEFREYKERYSNMTYEEYQKMKRGKGGRK